MKWRTDRTACRGRKLPHLIVESMVNSHNYKKGGTTMKKMIAMLLVTTMTIGLVACGNNAGTSDSGNTAVEDTGSEAEVGGGYRRHHR